MKVLLNDQTYLVGWKYIHSLPPELLKVVGLTCKQAKEMKKSDLRMKVRPILEFLGLSFPEPTRTECFILVVAADGVTKQEVGRTYVSLRGVDTHDVDKARMFSLDKVLKRTYPGDVNRDLRKAIWKAYHNRKMPKPVAVVSA